MPRKFYSEVPQITCSIEEHGLLKAAEERRLYLSGPIYAIEDGDNTGEYLSMVSRITKRIFEINKQDIGIPRKDRQPIILYINSPGGDIREGFSLVSVIELSKTPIYTVNTGEWSSMAFLIGITGHKRFSLPYMTFLLHEGSSFAGGSTNKVQDRIDFEKRFEQEIVKKHVLKHSKMQSVDYDALARIEYYMLPEDALARGFIDRIVKKDLDAIL